MNCLRRNLNFSALLFFLCILFLSGKAEEKSEPDFVRITTKAGLTYEDCFLKSTDAEGIVIQHRNGLVRLSLFDLSPELQEKFDFDPVSAMKAYRENEAKSREVRKQRILETARLQAEAERAATAEAMRFVAEKEWLPIEATIKRVTDDGAYAQVKEIVFLPTTQISTLGFENPGPPKRIARRFGTGLVFLQGVNHRFVKGEIWKGYMDPSSIRRVKHLETDQNTVPVHLAVPPR